MFIYPSLWINSQSKICTLSYQHKLLLFCGDIKSLPGPIRLNTQRDSLLICRGFKLFHQNVRGLHAKLNQITVFLCGRDIDFSTLSKTLITLKFSAFQGTTILMKVEQLPLVGLLLFIFWTNTTLYGEKIF